MRQFALATISTFAILSTASAGAAQPPLSQCGSVAGWFELARAERTEKPEQTEKPEKTEKVGAAAAGQLLARVERTEKPEQTEKPEKTEKVG